MDQITLQFRKANLADVDHFVKYRIDFLKEMHKVDPAASTEEITKLKQELTSYFEQALKSGQFNGFIAEFNNEIVSMAGIVVTEYPPVSHIKRFQGYLVNVYTLPTYRKKNIGSNLLKYLINDASKSGLTQLYLHTSPTSENVYRRLGFQEPETKALELKLL
jgi:N-acetylglutamate synthase-like GNAT family acetyltransferase